jgi:hypothetical protein
MGAILRRLHTIRANMVSCRVPLLAMRANGAVAIGTAELQLIDIQLTAMWTFLVTIALPPGQDPGSCVGSTLVSAFARALADALFDALRHSDSSFELGRKSG